MPGAPGLVGVLGGWAGHACRPFIVVSMHSEGMAPLACVSERNDAGRRLGLLYSAPYAGRLGEERRRVGKLRA